METSEGIVDFIDQIFTLMPIPVAVVVMFVSLGISKGVKRDAAGRLPWWFVWVPFGIGFLVGIPGYLVSHIGEMFTQPVWLTIAYSVQQGGVYGAVAIGLWSGRKIIPYFRRISENGNGDKQSQGETP